MYMRTVCRYVWMDGWLAGWLAIHSPIHTYIHVHAYTQADIYTHTDTIKICRRIRIRIP